MEFKGAPGLGVGPFHLLSMNCGSLGESKRFPAYRAGKPSGYYSWNPPEAKGVEKVGWFLLALLRNLDPPPLHEALPAEGV